MAAEHFDLDRNSRRVLDIMDPMVASGIPLSGYHRLVLCRNRADHIEAVIDQTDSLYRAYLSDPETGSSQENMLVSYVHFLCSNRFFGLTEKYADSLVVRYGAQRKYMDMRYMYYFLGASDRGDCAGMAAYVDSLRHEVVLQGSKRIVGDELVGEYADYVRRTCR